MILFKDKILRIAGLITGLCFFMMMSGCGTAHRLTHNKNKKNDKKKQILHLNRPDVSSSGKRYGSPPAHILINPRKAKSVEMIEKGMASWYGSGFNGLLAANGKVFNMHALTAAHRTLPFGTLVLVKNVKNGKSVVVKITDRGPFAKNRIIDLSRKAAKKLGMLKTGTAFVKLYVAQKALDPSDTTNLTVPTYTIQLGSFTNEKKAYQYAGKIKDARVEIVRIDKQLRYRVYYGLFIHKKKARQAAKRLEAQDYTCLIQQIEND